MRKSKQNQLTGGEKTLGENGAQPLLCSLGQHETVAEYDTGFGDKVAEEGAQYVTIAGNGTAGCLGVAHGGPQLGATPEDERELLIEF